MEDTIKSSGAKDTPEKSKEEQVKMDSSSIKREISIQEEINEGYRKELIKSWDTHQNYFSIQWFLDKSKPD